VYRLIKSKQYPVLLINCLLFVYNDAFEQRYTTFEQQASILQSTTYISDNNRLIIVKQSAQ
jgi:hypothetical protein